SPLTDRTIPDVVTRINAPCSSTTIRISLDCTLLHNASNDNSHPKYSYLATHCPAVQIISNGLPKLVGAPLFSFLLDSYAHTTPVSGFIVKRKTKGETLQSVLSPPLQPGDTA